MRKVQNKTLNASGFTLTEILIATFVVTLTAAGTFLLVGSGAQLAVHRSHRYEAYELGSQTLDTLKDYVSYGTTAQLDANSNYRLTQDSNAGADCAGVASSRYALKQLPAGQRHCHPLPATSLVGLGVGSQRQRTYQVTDVDLAPTFDSDGDGIVANDKDVKRVTVTVDWTEKR